MQLHVFLLYLHDCVYVCNYLFLTSSCGHFPVEGQENYCRCAWVCDFNLGAFWVAWVPPAYSCLPCTDPCIGSPFPLVQCIHLHQQVSILFIFFSNLSIQIHLRIDLEIYAPGLLPKSQMSFCLRTLSWVLLLHSGLKLTELLKFFAILPLGRSWRNSLLYVIVSILLYNLSPLSW